MLLRNTRSGAVVSCSEATAARLGRGWEPITPVSEQPAPEPVAVTPKRVRKPRTRE